MKKLIQFALKRVPRSWLQRIAPYALKSIAIFYRGNRYTCPIEGRSYRKFLPYGRINPRKNALCPGSMSLERHRLLWLFLKDRTNFFQGKKDFLHIAPEACFMPKFEELHGERYITGDLESPLAKVHFDIHEIPFEDNSFDIAMCNHVMEHVESDLKAMSEIYRVLRPGGWAIMQVPFFPPLPEQTHEDLSISDPKERERLFGQDDHVRKYGNDYSDRLKSVGFGVVEDHYCQELAEETRVKYALPGQEVIYFCTKKTGEND